MAFSFLKNKIGSFLKTQKVVLRGDLNHISNDMALIKEYCKSTNKFSWTSDAYQQAVHAAILSSEGTPGAVIEVGCYKGGLSAQIAYICSLLNKDFIYIDIDEASIVSTKELLQDLGLSSMTRSYTGTFQSFLDGPGQDCHCSFVIVDGDHEYEATVRDIQTILMLKPIPCAAVFHDYSLRSGNTNENVQQAITDTLPDKDVALIGLKFNGVEHPTVNSPNPDGHYWQHPGAEGALVTLI